MCGPGQQDADEHNAHWQAMNCIKVMNPSQDCLAGKEEKKGESAETARQLN